jgi:hypothetical protein
MTSTATALRLAPAVLFFVTRAALALPAECPGLGGALVDHSCFHTLHGPFKSVRATPGAVATEDTAEVSSPHTDYRIGLAGDVSVVTYVPERSGAWTIFLGSHLPFRVVDQTGSEVEQIFSASGRVGCEGLREAHVFELARAQRYRVVFGPTTATSVVAVVEFIDDFLVDHGPDADGDGYGIAHDVIRTPCVSPTGYAPNTSDCDDANPGRNPGARELCDGVDQNCNGLADDEGLECRAGKGECVATGTLRCEQTSGEPPGCTAAAKMPGEEICNGRDDDCDGIIDGSDTLCAGSSQGPSCVREGFAALCGCSLDQDCGSADSGRICDARAQRCIDGCDAEPGRNGCPPGSNCVSSSNADGVCVAKPSGTGGAGGAGEPPLGGSHSRSSDTQGCSCRIEPRRAGGSLAGFMALAFCALAATRRRGRARVSSRAGWCALMALALSRLSCGGRSVNDAEMGGFAGEASAQPGGAGGRATCVPVLGADAVAHACVHTDRGPYVPIAAIVNAAPDVSALHKTFSVLVVDEGAALTYVPKRQGQHVLLTDREVALSLFRAGATESLSGPAFDVQGCGSVARSRVADLLAGVRYQLRIDEPEGSEFKLFIEYPPAFGARAWKQSCVP